MSKGNSKDGERDAVAHSVLDLVGVCVVLPRSHSKFCLLPVDINIARSNTSASPAAVGINVLGLISN